MRSAGQQKAAILPGAASGAPSEPIRNCERPLLSLSKTILSALTSARRRVTNGPRKKAVWYYASSSIVCQCLRFLGILITTRAIPPAQFGLFAEAILVMSIAGLFRDIGQSGALVAYQGQDMRYVFFNFQMNLFLGSTTAVFIFGLYLAPALIPTELHGSIWLLAANPVLESLTQTNSLMLQKELRFKILGIAEVCSLLSWLTTVLVLINRVPGFLVLLGAQMAENICRCLALFAVVRFRFVGFAIGKDLKQYYLCQFVRPVVPLIVVQTLLSRTDYFLLGAFGTISELGTYERLNQFSRIPMSLTINLCDKVLMHSYSYSQNDRAALGRLVKKSMVLITSGVILITAAVTIALLIFLKPLVGESWAILIMNLWWFSIPIILLTPVLANLTLFFSGLGMMVQLLRNTAFNLCVDLALGFLLVITFGARGMLLTKSISGMLLLAYQANVLRRRLAPLTPAAEIVPTR
jgi:O-antigen/teichoic acid export membrane protein